MADENKRISTEALEEVNGGYNVWDMQVCIDMGYLALRPEPQWDLYHELAQIPNGATVYTNGEITNGTGLNRCPCQYRKIQYNGIWGWANAAYLR